MHENRIYSVKIVCGDNYPNDPPTVQFISQVNLPFVDQLDGKVEMSKVPGLAHWTPRIESHSIETVLVEIRRYVPPFHHITSELHIPTLQSNGDCNQQETSSAC